MTTPYVLRKRSDGAVPSLSNRRRVRHSFLWFRLLVAHTSALVSIEENREGVCATKLVRAQRQPNRLFFSDLAQERGQEDSSSSG